MKKIREKVYIIIFEADTFWGRMFDVFLLVAILLSILAVMLESISSIHARYGILLTKIEWVFTILFSIEYLLRIWVIRRPGKYIFSFYGIIDLLSVLPTYISLLVAGSQYFLVIRSIRLLRIFRILKMVRFMGEASTLMRALKASRAKIIVFIGGVFIIVVMLGSLMYVVEGGQNGFTSIPKSVYWAVVTLTTVGYGDIAPQTPLGQFLSTIIMVLGYGIIAIPTGIVSGEMVSLQSGNKKLNKSCRNCGCEGHHGDAVYCRRCGYPLT